MWDGLAMADRTRSAPISTPCNELEAKMSRITIAPTASSVLDSGAVRLGGMSPSLPTADAGKVRLGGMSPSLPTTDAGKVRLGGMSPSLPASGAGKVGLGGM